MHQMKGENKIICPTSSCSSFFIFLCTKACIWYQLFSIQSSNSCKLII